MEIKGEMRQLYYWIIMIAIRLGGFHMDDFSLLLLQIYSVKRDFDNGDWSSTAGWGLVDMSHYVYM